MVSVGAVVAVKYKPVRDLANIIADLAMEFVTEETRL